MGVGVHGKMARKKKVKRFRAVQAVKELARERMIHRARHGVASLRAIQGKRKHALIERGEEIRRTSVQGGDHHQCFPIHVAQTKIIQFAVFHTSRSKRALAGC